MWIFDAFIISHRKYEENLQEKIISIHLYVSTIVCLRILNLQELGVENFKWIFLEENQENEQIVTKINSFFFYIDIIFYRNIIGFWN